jgi:hypothetical protein
VCVKRYFTPLKPEKSVRDRYGRQYKTRRKGKSSEETKTFNFGGGGERREKESIFLKCSQVPHSRPFDKSVMKLKKLEFFFM